MNGEFNGRQIDSRQATNGERSATPRPAEDVQFLALAEAGVLEAQVVLLCQSIRHFGGAYANSQITIVSPRAARRPSRDTWQQLQQLGVERVELNLASACPDYGPSFRVHAAAHVANQSGPPILIQLDSDTLFLSEPDFSLRGVDVAARPVDVKGMCTAGAKDPNDRYWRALCALCNVDYELLPMLTSTVDRQSVRASYNGGLIAARRSSHVFETTDEIFRRMVQENLRPRSKSVGMEKSGCGPVSAEGLTFWGTSQAAISLACTKLRASVAILPATYNVPLHYFNQLKKRKSGKPVHVHYHWLNQPEERAQNPLLNGQMVLPESTALWIKARIGNGFRVAKTLPWQPAWPTLRRISNFLLMR